jgi:type II secretory pathway component PulF
MFVLAAIPHFVAFFGAILFGCSILLAVRILAGEEEGNHDMVHEVLRLVAWLLISAGILAVLLAAGVIPAIVAVIVFPTVVHRRRRAHRYALLAALAVAVERRIPLIPVLLAFSTERRGYVARRAMDLAARLQAGFTLPDAVDSIPGLFPAQIRLALRMGHDSGNLPSVLRAVLDRSESYDAVDGQIFGKITYFTIVFFFMLSIVTFMMMKIVPAFQKIFDDFEVELPAMTVVVVTISYGFLNFWYLALPFFFVAMAMGTVSALRYMGLIEHDLPGTTWLRRRVHTAAILETIAMFVAAKRPITDALLGLAHWYPVGGIRRRLVHALDDVQRGCGWCEALAGRNLISAGDRGVLLAAERVGNLGWASSELAESNRRRYVTRATAVIQTAFVLILLGYGVVVSFFFIGNFLPLIKLIVSLT